MVWWFVVITLHKSQLDLGILTCLFSHFTTPYFTISHTRTISLTPSTSHIVQKLFSLCVGLWANSHVNKLSSLWIIQSANLPVHKLSYLWIDCLQSSLSTYCWWITCLAPNRWIIFVILGHLLPMMPNVQRRSSLDLVKVSMSVQVWREFGKVTTLLLQQKWDYSKCYCGL